MRFVILIRHNPQAVELWRQLSVEQREAGLAAYTALNEELEAAGEMVVSAALADPALARRVTVRDGETIATDGPYAEVKEHLAGFYLVECDSIERAVGYAARIPEAAHMEIEVRPVLDRISVDM
jgi:hypothetical protein